MWKTIYWKLALMMVQRKYITLLAGSYRDTLKNGDYFYSKLPGDENNRGLQPGDFIYWKEHQMKDSLQAR